MLRAGSERPYDVAGFWWGIIDDILKVDSINKNSNTDLPSETEFDGSH